MSGSPELLAAFVGVLHLHGDGFRHGGYGRMPEGAGPGRLRLRRQQAGRAGELMFMLFFFPWPALLMIGSTLIE